MFRSIFPSLGLLIIASSCATAPRDQVVTFLKPGDETPWTHLDLRNDPEAFQFAIIADNAGGPRVGVMSRAVDRLNLLQPEFVMSVGDLIEGYDDAAELNVQWDEFMGYIDKLEPPFFFVPGNHDNGRVMWEEVYKKRVGPPYYHFRYRDVLFLCLSSNNGPENNTGIGDAQIAYIEQTLRENQDVRWTMVFLHKPMWDYENDPGWTKVAALLADRRYTAIAGHTHTNQTKVTANNQQHITLGVTGGGSALRGPAFGEFDQLGWVTMREDGPRIAIMELDGIHRTEFFSPEMMAAALPFKRGQAISATPIRPQGGTFQEGVSTLQVNNPGKEPLNFEGYFDVSDGMQVRPSSLRRVVAPGETWKQDLTVQLASAQPVAGIEPPILQWSAYFDRPVNAPAQEFHGREPLLIDAPLSLTRTAQAMTLDGNLADWPEGTLSFPMTRPVHIQNNVTSWRGPQDGSYRFGLTYDDTYVYFALDVTDDELFFKGWKYWSDFAGIYFDARPEGASEEITRKAVFSVLGAPELPESSKEYSIGAAPEGTQVFSQLKPGGYGVEIAIPVAFLNEMQGGDWKKFRINVMVNDHDPTHTGDGQSMLHWRPRWRDAPDQELFGVFTKQ